MTNLERLSGEELMQRLDELEDQRVSLVAKKCNDKKIIGNLMDCLFVARELAKRYAEALKDSKAMDGYRSNKVHVLAELILNGDGTRAAMAPLSNIIAIDKRKHGFELVYGVSFDWGWKLMGDMSKVSGGLMLCDTDALNEELAKRQK